MRPVPFGGGDGRAKMYMFTGLIRRMVGINKILNSPKKKIERLKIEYGYTRKIWKGLILGVFRSVRKGNGRFSGILCAYG
ncbi:hypothetical protein CEQ90_12910 [Lewinellaceae bacterium SD302]|nr:hypothetical protein CEQ90_12910 [Lewinellaceae bacterium SD302]